MSIGGVVINFMARTAAAVRDVGRFTTELEDLEDETDDIARDLDQLQRELDATGTQARGLDGDLQSAETGFQQFGDEVDDTLRRLKSDMNQMGAAVQDGANDVDRHTTRMRQDMGEAGRESGAEFVSNIAEGIGSGQANLNDVVTGTLGGLTNLAATLTGPIGLAAGAAAAGIGLVFAATKKQAEEAKERLEGIIGALQDVGDASSAAAKQALWDQWLDTLKASPEQLQKIAGALQTMGVDTREWQDALTGNEQAAQRIHDQMTKIITDVDYQKVTGGEVTEEMDRQRDAAWDVRRELEKQNTALGATKEYQSDLKWLTQGTASSAKEWAENTGRARSEAQRTKDILDALDGKDVRIDFVANYTGRESDWNPAARAGGHAPTSRAAAPPQPPIHVHVYESSSMQFARAFKARMEGYDVTVGRAPGAPRARAW